MVPGEEAVCRDEVSVIVPNWNGARRLGTLFESLTRQESIAEIVVVDNGSMDSSREVAAAAGARVIALDRNAGFSAAVNRGVREARADWVAVLNNDVELGDGWMRRLLSAAKARGAWFATGKLLDSRLRDRIDGTFDAICRGGTAWRCGAGQLDGPAFSSETQIQFAPFTALLLRRRLFELAGPLDERFESYLEDVDFGIRCAQRGYFGVYVPDAAGYHEGSATLGRWHADTVRRIARNQVYLIAKHAPSGPRWPVIVAQGLWGLLALRHGAAWPWFKGKLEGVRGFRAMRAAGGDARPMLAASERQMREIQKQTGADLYWKLYFALTWQAD